MEKGSSVLSRVVFFVGWLLSPLTFWNDVFVNIPLSYLMASLVYRLISIDFLFLVVVSYWISNIVGLGLMYISAKRIFMEGRGLTKTVLDVAATIVIYSAILVIISKLGILRPIRLFLLMSVVVASLSMSGCASIPIPSSIPLPNSIPILSWFL